MIFSSAMRASRGGRFFSSYSTTVTYTNHDDVDVPPPQLKTTQIPIDFPESPVPITVHLPTPLPPLESNYATKIQSAYRSHMIRTLVEKIKSVKSEADRLERLIQRQETVDAIRSDERERLKINEALMALLLTLDSVPGIDPTVRDLRRSVSHRIVGLQEILDAITAYRIQDWEELMRNFDEVVEEMEEDVCRERGGYEMERFCAEKLGFRCLQRFLREP